MITVPAQQGHMMQQMPMNAPPHHLQQNGPSHMGSAPNHMHPPMGPHGKHFDLITQNTLLESTKQHPNFVCELHSATTCWNADATNATDGIPRTSNATKCKSTTQNAHVQLCYLLYLERNKKKMRTNV